MVSAGYHDNVIFCTVIVLGTMLLVIYIVSLCNAYDQVGRLFVQDCKKNCSVRMMLSINFILSVNYEKKKRPTTSPVAEHLRPKDFSKNWGININMNAVKNRLNKSLTLNIILLRFKKNY